jgi:hypothetical protein
MSTGLELIRASAEHQAALGNLLELYMHDFSELVPLDVGDDGRYGYKSLPLFWSDNSRLPFLARLDGKLVGFVLITQSSEPSGDGDAWDMAEFFVLRRYRHRGIGPDSPRKCGSIVLVDGRFASCRKMSWLADSGNRVLRSSPANRPNPHI